MGLPHSLAPCRAPLRHRRAAGVVCAAVLAIGLAGCGTAAHATAMTATRAADAMSSTATTGLVANSTAQPLTIDGISRATPPGSLDAGRFADPYPIDVRAYDGMPLTVFSGTFDELMVCRGAISPGCFTPSRLTVTVSAALTARLRSDGDFVITQANHNVYRLPDGVWQMALSVQVKRGSAKWTLGLHASPRSGATTDGVPTRWVADSIIVGSPQTPADNNYDAKYLEADGQLYIVYNKHLPDPPNGVDGLVAQKMTTPSQPAGSPPVTLLKPSGLESERASPDPNDPAQLVETGNILEIGSVWVLIYSTGSVNHTNYKIGVAYADSPVPQGGYRTVLIPDPHRVWGTSGREVDYLLQSQEPDWPHYSRSAVQAPGVGSILHRGDSWYLFFAGYPPSLKTRETGIPAKGAVINPVLRVPYYVTLHVAMPHGAGAVAHASAQQLSSWISPKLNG